MSHIGQLISLLVFEIVFVRNQQKVPFWFRMWLSQKYAQIGPKSIYFLLSNTWKETNTAENCSVPKYVPYQKKSWHFWYFDALISVQKVTIAERSKELPKKDFFLKQIWNDQMLSNFFWKTKLAILGSSSFLVFQTVFVQNRPKLPFGIKTCLIQKYAQICLQAFFWQTLVMGQTAKHSFESKNAPDPFDQYISGLFMFFLTRIWQKHLISVQKVVVS